MTPTSRASQEAATASGRSSGLAYLLPGRGRFWSFEANGEVLVLPGGQTVAFGAEIAIALERLAPDGLPGLGAVALVLAAGRTSWPETRRRLLAAVASAPTGAAPATAAARHTLAALDAVHGVRRQLRGRDAAGGALVEAALRGVPRSSPAQGSGVARQVAALFGSAPLRTARLPEDADEAVVGELVRLAATLGQLDQGVLSRRVRTGLDAAPGAVSLPPERDGSFFSRLDADPRLRPVARWARALEGPCAAAQAVGVARAAGGGFAGLARRGDPARLLASEHAVSSLLRDARLATGEALYLLPAPAPDPRPLETLLVVDTGVRMWGAARVVAAAVAVALAAREPLGVRALSVAADRCSPLDVRRVPGVLALLERLSPHTDPGPAIETAIARCAKRPVRGAVTLVVHDALVCEPAFAARCERWARLVELRTVGVDARGGVVFRRHGAAGARVSARTRVCVGPTAAACATSAPPGARDLPATLFASRPPIRFPVGVEDPTRAAPGPGDGVVAWTPERRLLYGGAGGSSAPGARELVGRLPRGKVLALWCESGRALVVLEDTDAVRCVSVDLAGGESETLVLDGPARLRAVVAADRSPVGLSDGRPDPVALAVSTRAVDAVSLRTGERLARVPVPVGARWHHDRFLVERGMRWREVVWSGVDLAHRPLQPWPAPSRRRGVWPFRRPDREEVWWLDHEGRAQPARGPSAGFVGADYQPGSVAFVAASRCAPRLLVTGLLDPLRLEAERDGTRASLIDLVAGVAELLPRGERPLACRRRLERELLRRAPDRLEARTDGTAVGLDARGRPVVQVPEGLLRLEARGSQGLVWRPVGGGGDGGGVRLRPLRRLPHREGEVWSLRLAKADPSTPVVLDDRGLLHVRVPGEGARAVAVLVTRRVRGDGATASAAAPAPTVAWDLDGLVVGAPALVDRGGEPRPWSSSAALDALRRGLGGG